MTRVIYSSLNGYCRGQLAAINLRGLSHKQWDRDDFMLAQDFSLEMETKLNKSLTA